MPRRPKLRLITNAPLLPLHDEGAARPLLTPAQRRLLIRYAIEAEKRADAPQDIEPYDPATNDSPRPTRRRRRR
jgi:hypothetical protein